ncbi:MAG: tetratricopeptide repeat protein [Anaerolineales bacterium]|nr:tetratricopeptide repeat protein [Anaerolineales bacterium]
MKRRRQPINVFRILLLLLLVAIAVYINQVVVPNVPPPFVPTATATREPESYLTEAEGLFNQGKLLQAIGVYQEAIRIKPDDPAIYIALARVQVFAGQYKDARKNSENALLLNPNNSMAHAVRGWALTQDKDYLAAEAAVKRALELDPNNGLAHAYYAELLGKMYLDNTGPFDAITMAGEESRVATALAPNSLEARHARAFILEITDNREQAVQEYQAAIAINGNIADLHLSLGRTYRALGVLDKAIAEFTLAYTLNPSDPTSALYTSRAYASVREDAKAAQYAEQAVKVAPTDPYLRGNWGVMLYKVPDWPDAITQLSLAVNGGMSEDGQVIQPLTLTGDDIRLVEYFTTYALLLARMNRCGEALDVAQLILGSVPTDDIAVYNAQESMRICQNNLLTPSPIPQPSPTPGITPTP